MADPHIKSPMDIWDKLTVIIYRTGFVIAAFSIFALTWYPQQAQIAVLIAATCCASYLFKTLPLNIPICYMACTIMCAFRLA